jgi:hypothetical protein
MNINTRPFPNQGRYCCYYYYYYYYYAITSVQRINNYIPGINYVYMVCSVAAVYAASNVISHDKRSVLYISTSRSMCAVPKMAVCCSSLVSWFPGMLPFTYLVRDLEMQSTDSPTSTLTPSASWSTDATINTLLTHSDLVSCTFHMLYATILSPPSSYALRKLGALLRCLQCLVLTRSTFYITYNIIYAAVLSSINNLQSERGTRNTPPRHHHKISAFFHAPYPLVHHSSRYVARADSSYVIHATGRGWN